MQVKLEQIKGDIAGLEQELEQAKASVSRITGALTVLKNIQKYMEAPEPEPVTKISEANKAEQDELEAKLKEKNDGR
jgi:hypothetical protein